MRRFALSLWRRRWALVLVPAFATFLLYYLFVPETSSFDQPAISPATKILLSLILAVGCALLFGMFTAALHAVAHGRIIWLIGVLVFPPLSFVYFLDPISKLEVKQRPPAH